MNPTVERALRGLDESLAEVEARDCAGVVVALAARLASLGGRLSGKAEAEAVRVSPEPELRSESDPARCLRPEAVAQRLHLPLSRVYALLRTRRLPGFKEGKYWLIPEVALAQHLNQRVNQVALRGAPPRRVPPLDVAHMPRRSSAGD
jgi:excisionase family DNA binding protein